jgi:hypothetical protein
VRGKFLDREKDYEGKQSSVKRLSKSFFIALGGVCNVMILAGFCLAEEIIIKAGTPIPVRLEEALSSETAKARQPVRFTVVRDVEIKGKIVIKAGAPAEGEITYAQKTGSLGKEGMVHLVMRYTIAVDGTRIPLIASLSASGDDNVVLSGFIWPFIKGSSCNIQIGTEMKAYVDFDTTVNL